MEHPEAEEIEKYIVIDCDPGVDDCLALMIAFSQLPRIKIVGITTVRGNVDVRQVTMNALRVVKLYDKINEVRPCFCFNPCVMMVNIELDR